MSDEIELMSAKRIAMILWIMIIAFIVIVGCVLLLGEDFDVEHYNCFNNCMNCGNFSFCQDICNKNVSSDPCSLFEGE